MTGKSHPCLVYRNPSVPVLSSPQSQDRSSIDQKFASSFRRSRHSLSPSGRRSRSPSPAFASNSAQGSELLTECISMLSSIILEDCRFKYRPISLTHPPNALQALVLLITRFLVFKHRHDPKTVYLLLVALTPAFSTFGKEMHLRLLSFFEEVVVIILEIMDQSVDAKEQKKADGKLSLSCCPLFINRLNIVPCKSQYCRYRRSASIRFHSSRVVRRRRCQACDEMDTVGKSVIPAIHCPVYKCTVTSALGLLLLVSLGQSFHINH